jgi:stearoyl-CoA desaturase (delta-9 desaturase)
MKEIYHSLVRWFITTNLYHSSVECLPNKVDWVRTLPFIALNLSCLLVIWVGFSWVAFSIGLGLYFLRVFSIGAFYHRYFSHRTFKTNRFWQMIFAILGLSAAQRGPLWWAAHHRQHHICSDQESDVHSPLHHGFWWSHLGWFMSKKNYYYNPERIKDFSKFPELVFLDRFDNIVPLILGILLFLTGVLLQHLNPSLGTSGLQMFVWGFSISTVAVFHTTVSINSLSHQFGRRRYHTNDTSRNNIFLAILTLGEGWHNNHHHYPAAARQGFLWWEIDITYYLLKLFEKIGIIRDVRGVPSSILKKNLITDNT